MKQLIGTHTGRYLTTGKLYSWHHISNFICIRIFAIWKNSQHKKCHNIKIRNLAQHDIFRSFLCIRVLTSDICILKTYKTVKNVQKFIDTFKVIPSKQSLYSATTSLYPGVFLVCLPVSRNSDEVVLKISRSRLFVVQV